MLRAIIEFYCSLICQPFWMPLWLENKTPDKQHFHRRRYTAQYRQKQRIVKSLWFSVGLLAICWPVLHWLIGLGLLATFISFSILDETD